MLTHKKLEKKLSRKNIVETKKKRISRKKNYITFSLVYFIISLIQTYVIIYIPLFHFDVLNVNRANLSIIQVFSYLVLFSFPAFGFFFDKYSKYKKTIIICFCFLSSSSFLLFILNNHSLLSYAIFLVLYLVSQTVIRAGMSKTLLETSDKKSERNIIILINTCSSIGILLPSLLFKVYVKNIDSIEFWNIFFIVGWLITSPLLLIFIFMRKTSLQDPNREYIPRAFKNQNNMKYFSIFTVVFIFLAYFCLWSDKLIAYPFSSYMFSRFGEEGFSLYSDFYVIFIIFNITGFYLAKKLLHVIDFKEKLFTLQNKKLLQIIGYFTFIYLFTLVLLLSPNVLLLLFTYCLINLLGGLFVVLYTNIFLQISRTGKNENLRYWIMSLSSNIASITFLPLGTFLSPFLPMEALIIMVISLTSISIIFLNLSILTINPNLFIK